MSDEESNIPTSRMSGGPCGYGDPRDRSLRKIEKEVLIPKIVRERSKTEKCFKSKEEFDQCCLKNGPLMILKCREENREYQTCMNEWFHNKDFYNECKEIYLKSRSEFRTTGIKAKRTIPGKNPPNKVSTEDVTNS